MIKIHIIFCYKHVGEILPDMFWRISLYKHVNLLAGQHQNSFNFCQYVSKKSKLEDLANHENSVRHNKPRICLTFVDFCLITSLTQVLSDTVRL